MDREIKAADEASKAAGEEASVGKAVLSGLLYERTARYPEQSGQFSPTAFGNAIRRLETYARDRYKLDSQLLWNHLTAAAPDRQSRQSITRAPAFTSSAACCTAAP